MVLAGGWLGFLQHPCSSHMQINDLTHLLLCIQHPRVCVKGIKSSNTCYTAGCLCIGNGMNPYELPDQS